LLANREANETKFSPFISLIRGGSDVIVFQAAGVSRCRTSVTTIAKSPAIIHFRQRWTALGCSAVPRAA
jgi:hypothetical protein